MVVIIVICVQSLLQESALVGLGIGIRIERFLVQTLLGAWSGFGTQPHYEAPSDFHAELVENAVINIRLVRLSS